MLVKIDKKERTRNGTYQYLFFLLFSKNYPKKKKKMGVNGL